MYDSSKRQVGPVELTNILNNALKAPGMTSAVASNTNPIIGPINQMLNAIESLDSYISTSRIVRL